MSLWLVNVFSNAEASGPTNIIPFNLDKLSTWESEKKFEFLNLTVRIEFILNHKIIVRTYTSCFFNANIEKYMQK